MGTVITVLLVWFSLSIPASLLIGKLLSKNNQAFPIPNSKIIEITPSMLEAKQKLPLEVS